MAKVYAQGYFEHWQGFALSGDPEVMYSATGWVNTLIDPDAIDLDVVNLIDDVARSCWAAFVPGSYTLGQSFVLVGLATTTTDDVPPRKIFSTNAPSAGTHSGSSTALPNNCCWLVKKTTPVGKGGRCFIPAPPEADVSNTGGIDSTELGLRQADLNDLITNMAALNIDGQSVVPAIMHKNRAPLTGYSPQEVTAFLIDNRIATQRRRLRR